MLRRKHVSAARIAPLGAIITLFACSAQAPGEPSAKGDAVRAAQTTQGLVSIDAETGRGVVTRPMCPDDGIPGHKRCMAHVVTHTIEPDGTRTPVSPFAATGYGPSDIQSAYNIPTSGGQGKFVAVVDAYYWPSLESDLNAYRSNYGLPSCTKANGCLKEYFADTSGETQTPPSQDPQGANGWPGELMLDVDMISAACPQCGIIVVETSAPDDSLFVGAGVAAKHGAAAISNSFGGPESSTDAQSESYYNLPGVLITASAGDSGYGASYPATSAHVLAIGGTTLSKNGAVSRGWSETAWKSGGSGCSANIAEPSWQQGKTDSSCKKRMESDVSAVADPATGVAVYVDGSWIQVGGTSASSPIVAATFTSFGLAGKPPSFVYQNTSAFYDVTSGSNGSCSVPYYCRAGVGYDGPTGWGTPNGNALKALGAPPCTSNANCQAPTPV